MILNYVFLKSRNGMFYYGENYISACDVNVDFVFGGDVNNKNFLRNIKYFILIYFNCIFKGMFLFTPTIHPLPFLNRQLVICHDSYPFKGVKGAIKKKLLRFSLATSNCSVGYINHSDSKEFVDSLGICDSRKLYFPNLILESEEIEFRSKRNDKVINIALVGTDSDKKRYDVLFKSIALLPKEETEKYRFFLYGNSNDYSKNIVLQFSGLCELHFINSGDMDLKQFFLDKDAIVSVAKNEGFGRPIAFAIQRGLPAFLINDPVFNEFFSESAYIFESEKALLSSIEGVLETHEAKKFPSVKMIKKFNDCRQEFTRLCKMKR